MLASFAKTSIKTILLTGLSVGVLAISNAKAEDAGFNNAQKAEIKNLFKEYLMENPEIIGEAMNAMRMKQEQQAQEQAQAKIAEYTPQFKSDKFPYAGNKDGDVVVVEFYDYNCGYCKKAFSDVQALIKQDSNVRVVFVDMPILGPTSLVAAKWAKAAGKQGKYFEFHSALMEFQGNKDEAQMIKIATDLGLNIEQMKKDADSEEIQNSINENMQISQEIGVQGTPAFVVGDQFFRGYIGEEALISSVKSEREKG